MNRNLSFVMGIVVLLVLGTLFASYKHHALQQRQQATKIIAAEKPIMITGTMDDLLDKRTSMICTFSSRLPDQESTLSGTIRVTTDALRADVQAQLAVDTRTSLQTHMLLDHDHYYLRGMDQDHGYKVRRHVADAEKDASLAAVFHTPQFATQLTYTCRPSTHAENTFAIPQTIPFVDLSDSWPTSQVAEVTPAMSDECTKCADFNTNSARSDCRRILKCR